MSDFVPQASTSVRRVVRRKHAPAIAPNPKPTVPPLPESIPVREPEVAVLVNCSDQVSGGKVDVTPVDRPKVDVTPADRPKVDVTPADRPKVDVTPADRPKVDVTPVDRPKVHVVPTVTVDSIAEFVMESYGQAPEEENLRPEIRVHGQNAYLYLPQTRRWSCFPVSNAAKNEGLYAVVSSVEEPVRESFREYSPGIQSKLASTVLRMLVWGSPGYAKLCARIMQIANTRSSPEDNSFDADPNLLGFENGVLDMAARVLLAFSYRILVSCSTGYDYALPTDEESERCAVAIESIYPAHDDQIACVQVLAGGLDGNYYPSVFSQCGQASWFVSAMRDVLGPEYFREAGSGMFVGPDRSWLARTRMVFIQDDVPSSKIRATFNPSGVIESKKCTFPLRCLVFRGPADSTVTATALTMDATESTVGNRHALLNLLLGVRTEYAVNTVMQFDPLLLAPSTEGSASVSRSTKKKNMANTPAPEWTPLTSASTNKYGLSYCAEGTEKKGTERDGTEKKGTEKKGTEREGTADETGKEGNSVKDSFEIGVDEVGRGPLFGRTYVAAVVLPPVGSISREQAAVFDQVRDSKKISSRAKMREIADLVKAACPWWSIQFQEPEAIDRLNITQAIVESIGTAVDAIITASNAVLDTVHVLVDGRDFAGHWHLGTKVKVSTFDKGDNRFVAIACAAILAKDAHDTYILALCEERPDLVTKYSMNTNMGYGTAAHMDGIRAHGVTNLHRRSFAPVRRSIEEAAASGSTLPPARTDADPVKRKHAEKKEKEKKTTDSPAVCLFDADTVM